MRLEELRSPKLYAVFSSLDKGTGRLREGEALEAILELVRTFEGAEGETGGAMAERAAAPYLRPAPARLKMISHEYCSFFVKWLFSVCPLHENSNVTFR